MGGDGEISEATEKSRTNKYAARTRRLERSGTSETHGPHLIRRLLEEKKCLDEGGKWTEGVAFKFCS